jgi:FkbM family methyltransferase
MLTRLRTVVEAGLVFLEFPGAVRALWAWPRFSVTSYRLVARLAAQGIAPRTVLDVGANVGQFAVAAAELLPVERVHCFEPVPETVAGLRRTTARLPAVQVHAVALGDTSGEIDFRVNRHSHSSSALRLSAAHVAAFPDAREVAVERVPVRTLDDVLAGVPLSGPVLLKLDVQGYELRVLRGGAATLRRVDFVVLEASFRQLYVDEPLFNELAAEMAGMGFDFVRPLSWLTDPRTGEILQMDALFARAAVTA